MAKDGILILGSRGLTSLLTIHATGDFGVAIHYELVSVVRPGGLLTWIYRIGFVFSNRRRRPESTDALSLPKGWSKDQRG
jgi:hypothetical protein